MDFFKEQYWKADAEYEWRRIDMGWLGGSSELALQLDSLTNNTSLVVAIELSDGGDVLLCAADAQVGNWLYIGGGKARERSGGRGCASR
jgi:hypothetical protein